MRKKYLSALLFGALLFASAGTFTSCKDYDDDINNLSQRIDQVASDLNDLKTKVDALGCVESIEFKDGQLIVHTASGDVSANMPEYTGIKEVKLEGNTLYVDGEAAGTVEIPETPGGEEVHVPVISVKDGKLYVDDQLMDIEVGSNVIMVDNGDTCTLTVDGQSVELMKAGTAMAGLNVINAGVEDADYKFKAYYDINSKDVEYGPEGNKKTLKAGLYTTLDRDLKIVVNPRSVDASLYTFALKNSAGVNTELTFKEAVPFEGALSADDVTSRAASANSIWVLENDYTRYDNNNLTDIRTNLYQRFKSNDGENYALTLEASVGNSTFNTPYDLSAELQEMPETTPDPKNMEYILINTDTKPVINYGNGAESAVYDYWLTLKQSALNLQKAEMYGVEISEDGHTFKFTKEAGIGNEVEFVYNYILLNGTVVDESTKNPSVEDRTFTAKFSQETASADTKVLPDFISAFDAELITTPDNPLLKSCGGTANVPATEFGMNHEYDLATIYNELSDANKLVWNSAIEQQKSISFELFGGEGDNNYGTLNSELLSNIRYSIDNKDKKITLQFLVDKDARANATTPNTRDGILAINFTLDNAYELVMTVKDPIANNTVLTLKFPFELQQPTMDIIDDKGNFSEWTVEENTEEEVLMSYGAYDASQNIMYLPLYESFKAWTKEYTVWDANAQYYYLKDVNASNDIDVLGVDNAERALNNNLNYTTVWADWNTKSTSANAASNGGNEASTMVEVVYNHYGVYPEDLFTNGRKNEFKLVFASLLKHSSLKMASGSETLTANAGTNDVFISDNILDLQTPKEQKFYLFDGLNSGGTVITRAELNRNSFNEEQRPFIDKITASVVSAKDKNGTTSHNVVDGTWTDAMWVIDPITGERSFNLGTPDASNIRIFNIPAFPAVQDPTHQWTAANVVTGYTGGLAIQLPSSIADKEEVEITITLNDHLGFTNELKFTISKID